MIMSFGYLIFIYWILAAVFMVLGIIGYYIKVLGTLGKHGYDDTIKILPSSQIKQIKTYEQICRDEGLPIGWARFLMWFPITGVVIISGWFGLLALD